MSNFKLEIQRIVEDSEASPSDRQLSAWAEAALGESDHQVEMVIRIVDESESRQLNRDYRGMDKPTNVLSFPFESPPEVALPLLGDLVICAPVVSAEARQQNKTLEAHWAHMVVHGTLHLQGYDHQDDQQAQLMEDKERQILQALNFSNPYTDEK
ncbi:MAG: rRNA maturation RNase YbeY [Candidatus Thiodiazotropha lotti]|uniref:Endoribonuclease YbeY n=1 Tax=Candidatus Thiodiazotropha endoloripes TaxID=1818881 RepID=A0A1E2UNU1_9GAMM|nr:rRNA maturation RNase YbeY [Candidatus Thiodiazotropha endoloripes]MCG7899904.1 rRNA maturation RNase YbeY [Candidatus Thiodiazotropha weberae]MCG7993372.1 rRNA maturation RNase YbeY [Candidatus Thiodiazotropha lotti]MCG7901042.1 rRNA maturation RNase YbeY [Candidatus Thiodiazotropha weberae]MCG7913359.1 rRNA maturation RNase YbeY [Candidatus Thiodiazotropha weberae]MCG7998110.1 rRNA maturation RNase YbeY [Candidatus Thiodiazotropha lotti]